MLLGVNIDHIATLRQARYATMLDSFNVEPSVLDAAYAAQRGGADSITLHVRGDRRHMQDADALSVRESVALPLNLEMGNTPEMVDFALRLKPDYVCMVPEKREEITTEGGLDAVFHEKELAPTGVPYLHELNIGHTIVARALFVGMEQAVREMRQAIDRLS